MHLVLQILLKRKLTIHHSINLALVEVFEHSDLISVSLNCYVLVQVLIDVVAFDNSLGCQPLNVSHSLLFLFFHVIDHANIHGLVSVSKHDERVEVELGILQLSLNVLKVCC